MHLRNSIRRAGITVLGLAALLPMTAVTQELRSEIAVQGTGFFTKNSKGHGIRERATESGGVLFDYRYNLNYWLAADVSYAHGRNTQIYSGSTQARVQANLNQFTGAAVVKLPPLTRLQPYVLAGGGGLVFSPTRNAGGTLTGTTRQTRGAFLYGVGADYALTDHISFRIEYRGLVYKAPTFHLSRLNTSAWTRLAQPSVGIVFRF
jgi:outer membrane immunogenic protein